MLAPDFTQAQWHKSTRSHGGGGECVMVAHIAEATGVKDSKLGDTSPILPFTPQAWTAFLRDVKQGKHDPR